MTNYVNCKNSEGSGNYRKLLKSEQKNICLLYTSPSPRDELYSISYAVFCLKKKKKKKQRKKKKEK